MGLTVRKLLDVYFEKWELQNILDKLDEIISGTKPEIIERIIEEWPAHGHDYYNLFKSLDRQRLSRICKAYKLDSKGNKDKLVQRIKKHKLLDSKSSAKVKTTEEKIPIAGNAVFLIILIAIGISIGYVYFYGIIPERPIVFSVTGGFIHQQDPDFPEDIDMIISLKTTLLSAQNSIDVDAKMIPSEAFYLYKPDPWPLLPSKQYLMFPGAINLPMKNFPEGSFAGGIIELEKYDEPREYRGVGKIMYQTGGNYGFLFVGQNFIDEHSFNNHVEISMSDIEPLMNEKTKFEVQPDQTAVLIGGKYTVISVLVGLGVAITKYREKFGLVRN